MSIHFISVENIENHGHPEVTQRVEYIKASLARLEIDDDAGNRVSMLDELIKDGKIIYCDALERAAGHMPTDVWERIVFLREQYRRSFGLSNSLKNQGNPLREDFTLIQKEMEQNNILLSRPMAMKMIQFCHSFEEAEQICASMEYAGITPDLIIYNAMLAKASSFGQGIEIIGRIIKDRLEPDIFTINSLLTTMLRDTSYILNPQHVDFIFGYYGRHTDIDAKNQTIRNDRVGKFLQRFPEVREICKEKLGFYTVPVSPEEALDMPNNGGKIHGDTPPVVKQSSPLDSAIDEMLKKGELRRGLGGTSGSGRVSRKSRR